MFGVPMEIMAWSDDPAMLIRPCVECSKPTGNWCDGWNLHTGGPCLAAERMEGDRWEPGQCTPICTKCDQCLQFCRFCRAERVTAKAGAKAKPAPPRAPAADALTEQQIIDAMAAAGYRFVPSTETEETEA